jgi:hypothetical protein
LHKHLVEVLQQNPDKSSVAKNIILSFRRLEFPENSFQGDQWIPYITDDQAIGLALSEVEENGYTLVSVYHMPKSGEFFPNWVFAKDSANQQYYLHKEKCASSAYDLWENIIPGKKLAILPGIKPEGKSTPAEDIVWVNEQEKQSTINGDRLKWTPESRQISTEFKLHIQC